MARNTLLALLALLLVPAIGLAGDTQWLHVAVDGDDDERVRVNVPLSLVSAILPLIEDDDFRHGRITLEGEEFDRADVVAILKAVAVAEDGEYVTIDDREDRVRVVKRGRAVQVLVEERHRRSDEIETEVRVMIPVAVLDALASGEGNELDIVAAVEALGEHASVGDLVTVHDGDERVRIWIDRQNQSD